MLLLLLIIPILGCLLILSMKILNKNKESILNFEKKIKSIALISSLIDFLISIKLWIEFDSNLSQYQFVQEFNSWTFFHLNIGIDGISLYFVLLTTFITPIAILSNWDTIVRDKQIKLFYICILLLETLQIFVFISLDLFLFYIFFESVLIPLFLLVGIWGASKAKNRAAFLLFLYTFSGSLAMLLAILYMYYNIGSTDYIIISLSSINLDIQKILWLCFFLSFAVKTPLWPVHLWLFRAHSEAPLAGSIILAATILKLATYGYLRILINFLPDATQYFIPLVQSIAILTIIYASISTIRQEDTKALVAMSSVVHMGSTVIGLFTNSIQGIEGSIIMSLSHGFISPALFILVGGVIYDQIHSRLIPYIKGLATYMPIFSIYFLIFILFNTSIPLSFAWVGEQMTLIGVWERNPIIAILGASSIFLTACYSVFFYNRISFGFYSPHLNLLRDINRREFFLLLPLLMVTLILGIFPNLVLDSLHISVTNLLY